MSNNKSRALEEDKLLRDKAKKNLAKMKQIEREKDSELRTVIYSNGMVVKTNNKELIETYNKRYGKL